MNASTKTSIPSPAAHATIWSKPFVLTWLSTWMIFLGFYFLLPTLPGYFIQIGGKESHVGLLLGLFTITAMLSRPIGGRLSDTKGKTWTMLFGAAVLTATILFYYLAKTPGTLLTLRFFHGFGWGIYLTGAVSLIADIAHPTQRATMTGHYFLANTLAMVFGPWLGTVILAHSNYTMLFSAFIGLTALALVVIWPLHRDSLPVQPMSNGRWVTPRAWLPSLTILSAAFTYGGVVSFLPLYASGRQVSMFYAVYAVSLGLSRPVGGWLADKFGRHVVILPGLLLLAGSVGSLAWTNSSAGFALMAVVYGVGFGSAGTSLNAFTIDRVPAEERGAAMGMYTAAFELGLALGSVALGFVLEHGGFARMWLAAAAAPLVGFALFAARWRR